MENTCSVIASAAFQLHLPRHHPSNYRYGPPSTVTSLGQSLVPRWRVIGRHRRELANERTCNYTVASPAHHDTAGAGGGRRRSEETRDGGEKMTSSSSASPPSVGMSASTKSRQWPEQEQAVATASERSRRRRALILSSALSLLLALSPSPNTGALPARATVETPPVAAAGVGDSDRCPSFHSGAYGSQEYTNSLTASRDTNISPREVYDSIASKYLRAPLELRGGGDSRPLRALDIGAGAGVSTQILHDMGYTEIDAVDWSGDAWERYVTDDPAGCVPPGGGVRFFEMDDERYRASWRREGGGGPPAFFDAIVFNFAVNEEKARSFASELLARNDRSRLLAPVNVQKDYWLRQEYRCYDRSGNVLWRAGEVGAWSVQFQPDVTQDSCQGIWCAQFNGFKKMGTTGGGALD